MKTTKYLHFLKMQLARLSYPYTWMNTSPSLSQMPWLPLVSQLPPKSVPLLVWVVFSLLAIIDPFLIFHWFCLVFLHTWFQSHSLHVVYLTLCFPSCPYQRLFVVCRCVICSGVRRVLHPIMLFLYTSSHVCGTCLVYVSVVESYVHTHIYTC